MCSPISRLFELRGAMLLALQLVLGMLRLPTLRAPGLLLCAYSACNCCPLPSSRCRSCRRELVRELGLQQELELGLLVEPAGASMLHELQLALQLMLNPLNLLAMSLLGLLVPCLWGLLRLSSAGLIRLLPRRLLC